MEERLWCWVFTTQMRMIMPPEANVAPLNVCCNVYHANCIHTFNPSS